MNIKIYLKVPVICACIVLSSCSGLLTSKKTSGSDLADLYENETAESWAEVRSKSSPVRGWEYVIQRLEKKGIPLTTLSEIYSSPRIPLWTPITFKVKPKEGQAMYKELANKSAQANARSFLDENAKYFKSAESKFSVPKEIIVSILQVETQCGKNTGNEPVIYWLSRLVSTGFPPNITYNFDNTKEDPKPSLSEFEERAKWLETEFMPHLLSAIQLSSQSSNSAFDIKGSKGGAIGMAQFLPKNVEKYGIDGDHNGIINIHTPADAIFSVANFLSQHGWAKNLSEREKTSVLLEYNRSTSYVDTVISLASSLKK